MDSVWTVKARRFDVSEFAKLTAWRFWPISSEKQSRRLSAITLNQIAVGQAVDLSVVHAAIAAITEARDILTDLAEAPDSN